MDKSQFWRLIEATYEDDSEAHAENLKTALIKLEASEIEVFKDIFDEFYDAAYRWDLWAVAYVIAGGCSDDCFMDFRAMVVRRGEEFYHAMMDNPEAAALKYNVQEDDFDGMFSYGIAEAYEERTGQPLPPRKHKFPDQPAGEDWREEDLAQLFPELCKKH